MTKAKLGIAGALTRAFITSPLTPLFLLASLALGLVALVTLPREEEPQISVPMVDIHIMAPGLKAEDAVKLVTEPLETVVKSINGVEHVYSQTQDDGALVTARFLVGTPADAAILRVHEKIRANIDRLPKGIPEPLIVGRGIDDVAILVVTLTPEPQVADRWTAADLTRVAAELQVALSALPDVGLTYPIGAQTEELRVVPDPERLAQAGLTLQALAAKLEGANASLTLGTIRADGGQIPLAAGETLTDPAQIANLLITTRDGRPIYLRDVADVLLEADPAETRVFHLSRDGEGFARTPAVSLAVAKRAGANAVTIAHEIRAEIDRLTGTTIPPGLQAEITRDYGETADEKANELLFHLALATLSIVALVWLAIGWREAAVVLVVIPVTILLTLFAARVMGYTLNRVSLFALIFSIGILVDDAIVVIENIARHWGMKDARSRKQAAIDAVGEVGNPTIIATLTVVAALLPMLFVSGMMGPYMSPIPANASAAMLFSFFVAVIVTPWLMLKFGGGAGGHAQDHGTGGRLGALYLAVARPILATRRRAGLFLLLVTMATIGSMGLFYTRDVTVKLLPFDNKSELSIMVDLPRGAAVEETDRSLQQIAAALAPVAEIDTIQSHAGTASAFNFNGLVRHYYLRSEPRYGDLQINLLPKGERTRESHAIALDLRARITALDLPKGTVVKVVEPPPGPPVMATLLAEIYGPDPETRRAVATKLRQIFASVSFIVDVDDSFGTPGPRQRLLLDDAQLAYHRVEQGDVFQTLHLLYHGTTVGYSHRDGGRRPLPITLAPSKSGKVLDERALATPVPANLLPGDRAVVELGDVVTLRQETQSFPIFRHNGKAAEMVTAELAGDFEAPLYGIMAVNQAIEQADWGTLPKPEIRLNGQPDATDKPVILWDGEWEVTWVTFRDMGAAFMVALLGIYILVVLQFGSFKLPLVILTPVPLTFIGILGGHWLFGAPFSATSMIGFIALAGIIVRNSILLVDFIRHAHKPGAPLLPVLLEAGAIRFKPILLTALAAIIGAITILTDPIFQGLAISLLFGLASSTLLTVLVIPAIYILLRGGRAA
ncbi:efflux RND transporter permease subunit [Neogemmobacter tilapiae]|uniref:Multidrug transporter AcrB n=1 Tax=Neogemmobacter tilapiae TaxID=875041 RepID=A0A918TVM3_9RHOB|nr:efflux RND transporter permease subunit [Gemmobacter tilapiae]GHC60961.1 multidrug transporter AcrB [Gemmobacter tilapiae]